jgi:WXG100 family type VII secretion target
MAGNGSFMVDLRALSDAIVKVSAQRDAMNGEIQTLRSTFNNIQNDWQSPAGSSFVGLVANFNSVADHLMAILDDAISRMRTAYQNYAATEAANLRNLQGHSRVALSGGAATQKISEPAPAPNTSLREPAIASAATLREPAIAPTPPHPRETEASPAAAPVQDNEVFSATFT